MADDDDVGSGYNEVVIIVCGIRAGWLKFLFFVKVLKSRAVTKVGWCFERRTSGARAS